MTCDDYQIAFDQQRAGATPAIAADALAAHIAGCSACAAYVALTDQVTASMTTALSTAPALATPQTILDQVALERRRLRRMAVLLPLFLLAFLAIPVFIHGSFDMRLMKAPLFSLGVAGVIAAVVLLWRMRSLRALTSTDAPPLISGWTSDLERKMRISFVAAFGLIVLMVGLHIAKFGFGPPSKNRLITQVGMTALAGLHLFVALKLKRQRDELRA